MHKYMTEVDAFTNITVGVNDVQSKAKTFFETG